MTPVLTRAPKRENKKVESKNKTEKKIFSFMARVTKKDAPEEIPKI